MARFRKRPIEIDAIWVTFDLPLDALLAFLGDADFEMDEYGVTLSTLEGKMLARPGDWIIRGIKGELYPCKPEVFVDTYELVEPSPDPVTGAGGEQ